ncbi:type ISP restriction/modification enzyme [Polaribacter atrinae]|uniref:type ISP restriction/modification enzyme n=1 Tax=Polaribacter atrinae TaxID=1333662 RepID=UPI00248FDF6D|nr:type ISP restriction/modification enzyme [Polaribacter atrinae]
MTIESYIDNLNQRYTLGNATEHTFRGDLQQLLETLLPEIRATNEPKRQSCGAPDYILTKKEIPVGFIEAKDIGDKDLLGKKKTGNKEQFDRYKASLSNLIFTDYIDFHIYQDGEFITKIAIAEVVDNQIKPLPENFTNFKNLITDFTSHISQNIKSSKKLAEMMAGKARLLSDVIEKSLISDEDNLDDTTLKEQMMAFKDILIHDITPKGFADVYAQTIAYGLFAARLHDPTLDTFSRQEAAELIPKSNPFLRKLFGYIAGADIDDRIKWIVDNLAEIFLACNVEEILKNYGKSTKMEDPIIHFYETFLAEYDPKLRKARGVWYTPAPVVNFIVRAVDDILKTEFDLPQGLADSSKTTVKVKTDIANKNFKSGYKEVDKEVHKVQVLDPATGTGTFLAEVIKHVHKKFKGQSGIWSSYAENNLLPRLNGFELLMASYAMAHLQIDLLLRETGFKATKNQRTKIYLTNSLEEYHPDTGTLFANWLSGEANEANHIKRDTPVMCIIGNPPYSGESANKGDWIMSLMDDYKKEPGGKVKLKERNPKWINDDYVKFLRYGQHFIEKNGTGVLAFINPHGFLDNPTFRGMRWNLLKTYDKIYTIDLHGNSKKKETAPDGSVDVNVFDIMQGVSINIFVKTGKKKANELAKVFHYDLYGKRDFKYDFLSKNSIKTINYKELPNVAPNYFMVQKDFEAQKSYDKGLKINELFKTNNVGIVTSRDGFVIDENKNVLSKRISNFFKLTKDELLTNYKIRENKTWKIDDIKIKANNFKPEDIKQISYRPFDNRYIYYNDNFIERSRKEVMAHLQNNNNIALAIKRQCKMDFSYIFLTNKITESCLFESAYANNSTLPLYLYPESNNQKTIEEQKERTPNLDLKIVDAIAKKIKLTFTNEKEQNKDTFAPIDILDYIYALLHSPTYREKYKEFLKIDFPRVPYPKDQATFWQLVKLGKEIREIHLLESAKVDDFITSYLGDGDNVITRKLTKTNIGYEAISDTLGKVWINDTQYFNNVPLVAWEFFIGGYQPAQKWLKDRKDRTLDFEDIFHYQKIIVALTETHRIMQEIDTIEIE